MPDPDSYDLHDHYAHTLHLDVLVRQRLPPVLVHSVCALDTLVILITDCNLICSIGTVR